MLLQLFGDSGLVLARGVGVLAAWLQKEPPPAADRRLHA